jgi:DEAD/DEAH box helicase
MKRDRSSFASIEAKNSFQSLQSDRQRLPIFSFRQDIIEQVIKHNVLVLVGETGSGKTTQVVQFLWESRGSHPVLSNLFSSKHQVVITQPRRVAAITVARRIMLEMGAESSSLVGYSVRFEDTCTPSTRIKLATDGMLLREAQIDPALSRYSVIVLDEAHERTVNTDVLFGIIKNAMKVRNNTPNSTDAVKTSMHPLKVIIMSATINVNLFVSYFSSSSEVKEIQNQMENKLTTTTKNAEISNGLKEQVFVQVSGGDNNHKGEKKQKKKNLNASNDGIFSNKVLLALESFDASVPSHQTLESFPSSSEADDYVTTIAADAPPSSCSSSAKSLSSLPSKHASSSDVGILTIPGRQYPVDIFYSEDPQESYIDAAISTVLQVSAMCAPISIIPNLFLLDDERIPWLSETFDDNLCSIRQESIPLREACAI